MDLNSRRLFSPYPTRSLSSCSSCLVPDCLWVSSHILSSDVCCPRSTFVLLKVFESFCLLILSLLSLNTQDSPAFLLLVTALLSSTTSSSSSSGSPDSLYCCCIVEAPGDPTSYLCSQLSSVSVYVLFVCLLLQLEQVLTKHCHEERGGNLPLHPLFIQQRHETLKAKYWKK